MENSPEVYFAVKSKLGKQIRTTKSYWKLITTVKHPDIAPYKKECKQALADPEQIRQSLTSDNVFLYYKSIGKLYVCVVAAHENHQGFIITAYLTSKIREGKQIWPKEV